MALLLGEFVARLSTGDLKVDIRNGREWLRQFARGGDFGYDALRWHEHLWATDAGGYRWCCPNAREWTQRIRAGMSRPGWVEAVRALEAEDRGRAEPGNAADGERP